jgi:hypothetical protein
MENDRIKMAVLCMFACNEPLAWMYNMFVELTKGWLYKFLPPF